MSLYFQVQNTKQAQTLTGQLDNLFKRKLFCPASFYSLWESEGLFGEVIKTAGPTKTFFPESGHKFKGTLLFPSTWGETSADNRGCLRHSPDLHLRVISLWCQTSKGPLWIWCPQRVKDSLFPNCANRFFKCLQRIITACWGSSAATWGPLAEEDVAAMERVKGERNASESNKSLQKLNWLFQLENKEWYWIYFSFIVPFLK